MPALYRKPINAVIAARKENAELLVKQKAVHDQKFVEWRELAKKGDSKGSVNTWLEITGVINNHYTKNGKTDYSSPHYFKVQEEKKELAEKYQKLMRERKSGKIAQRRARVATVKAAFSKSPVRNVKRVLKLVKR
ncbi:MAG: hypothetical protein WC821_03030 [archaeon]